MSDQQPDLETRRQILQNKLQQYRAKGYDHQVTAQIAETMGSESEAQTAKRTSDQMYRAARETEALLDDLPEPDEDTDEG